MWSVANQKKSSAEAGKFNKDKFVSPLESPTGTQVPINSAEQKTVLLENPVASSSMPPPTAKFILTLPKTTSTPSTTSSISTSKTITSSTTTTLTPITSSTTGTTPSKIMTTPAPSVVMAPLLPSLTPYDGRTSCSDFLSRFESLSTVSGWDDDSKASYFSLYLHGTARNWNIAYTNSRELAGLTGPPTWKDLKDAFNKAFKVKVAGSSDSSHTIALTETTVSTTGPS